jgi:hypothetical protein
MIKCQVCGLFPASINGYCRNCLPQKEKKKKEIKRVSTKREKQDREYNKLRSEILKTNTVCHGIFPGCTMVATDVHHTMGRLKYYLVTSTWVPLCRNCHRYVEDNPKEAKLLNLSKSRHGKD